MNDHSYSFNRLTSVFFTLFCLVPLALLLYVFYGMDVRSRFEDVLFDWRVRVQPAMAETSRLAVVSIGQRDIEALEGENVNQPSLTTLQRVLEGVLAQGPQAVGLVIPHHDLDYEGQEFASFVASLRDHPNVYLASFDLNFNEPTDIVIPAPIAKASGRVFAADTLRKYKREVVRSLPLMSYQGAAMALHLPTRLALDYADADAKAKLRDHLAREQTYYDAHASHQRSVWHPYPLPSIRLNYFPVNQLVTVKGSKLNTAAAHAAIKDKVVLVGYTAFRKRDFVFREGTHVNTPWEGDMTPEVFGFPLIYVLAVQLQNLIEGSWLQEGAVFFVVVQTLLCSLISYFAWRLAPFLAVLIVVGLFSLLFYCHGLLMVWGHIWLPMADTVLFAVVAMIAGAFQRAHADHKQRALHERRAKSQRELALLQGRLLNRFAFELYELNLQLVGLLSRHEGRFAPETTMGRVFNKAISSGAELSDYLSGIKHYAALMENQDYQVHRGAVPVSPLLRRVLNQFDIMIATGEVEVDMRCCETLAAYTDEQLLEPIIFNLVSNAIKYSPRGGTVVIEVMSWAPHHLRFTVKDEGPGIAPEYHEKIFEKFYRIKTDQVYEIKGNGLGLYLCRYFSRQIGATLGLISRPQEGCEFSLVVERCRL